MLPALLSGANFSRLAVAATESDYAGTRISNLTFSPDGARVAFTTDSEVRVWNLLSNTIDISCAGLRGTFLPSNKALLVLDPSSPGDLDLTRCDENDAIPLISAGVRSPIQSFAFAATRGVLATAHQDGQIRIWNTPGSTLSDKPLCQIQAPLNTIQDMVFSGDGRVLAAFSTRTPRSVSLWDSAACKPVAGFPSSVAAPITAIALNNAGSNLAVGLNNGTIILWDIRNGKQTATTLTAHKAAVGALAFVPGSTALISGSKDKVLFMWDEQGTSRTVPFDAEIVDIAFAPDGRQLVIAGADGVLYQMKIQG